MTYDAERAVVRLCVCEEARDGDGDGGSGGVGFVHHYDSPRRPSVGTHYNEIY